MALEFCCVVCVEITSWADGVRRNVDDKTVKPTSINHASVVFFCSSFSLMMMMTGQSGRSCSTNTSPQDKAKLSNCSKFTYQNKSCVQCPGCTRIRPAPFIHVDTYSACFAPRTRRGSTTDP